MTRPPADNCKRLLTKTARQSNRLPPLAQKKYASATEPPWRLDQKTRLHKNRYRWRSGSASSSCSRVTKLAGFRAGSRPAGFSAAPWQSARRSLRTHFRNQPL